MESYSDRRKIDPTRGEHLGDGTANDNDRVEIGPTQLAFRKWRSDRVKKARRHRG